MIVVKDLYKNFKQQKVLKAVNFSVSKGEVVCIIGPSGSGKSTLLRCINLLENPTSGQIIITGTDITSKRIDINKIRSEVGMVFQHFNLFPHKTVLQNIMLAPLKVKKQNTSEAKKYAMRLLEKVGLASKKKYVSLFPFRRSKTKSCHRTCISYGNPK